ncbi:Phosphoheptose isomerase [Chlamydiales bacterium SCGC AG-110-M15]|nr:Phosphoheptose isomerase [Chlamydiales bacterium SCGC AG-110-M15]
MKLLDYAQDLSTILQTCSLRKGEQEADLNLGLNHILEIMTRCKQEERTCFFIGNGGSASIASHIALDFWKAAGIRAQHFNDSSLLTCLSNDFSYEEVFSKPICQFANEHDVLFAISSSGQSENILNGAKEAQKQGCYVITLSGFSPNNPLRKIGDLNLYIDSPLYGPVEIAHSAILHFLIDSFIHKKQQSEKYTKNNCAKR